jgi:PAS domain-containing protein
LIFVILAVKEIVPLGSQLPRLADVYPVQHVKEGTMSRTRSKTHEIDAEEVSKAVEGRLRPIIDAIPVIVWRKFPDGSADFLNKQFREYTGLSLEDGMGWGWMNAFHPDDRLMEEWHAAFAAGKPFKKQARLRRSDGQGSIAGSRFVRYRCGMSGEMSSNGMD